MQVYSKNLDITMVQGNTPTIIYNVVDENNEPYPLTGASAVWVLFDQFGNILSTKTTSDSITFTSPNIFNVPLAYADTNTIFGSYGHELAFTDSTNNILTVTKEDGTSGQLTINPRRAVVTPT